MNPEAIDWEALERLRSAYLAGTAGAADYWQSASDLSSYDLTFAQRIGWKWDHVLGELQRRGWTPPPGEVLDWGCGSGIAGRAFLDTFGTSCVTALRLWDRSDLAMHWAAQRARDRFPALDVDVGFHTPPAVLLLSHVLTELKPGQLDALITLASQAHCVLWVEPGTYETSRALIAQRERLRNRFHLLGPCPHREPCGLLTATNERHWCHHFAEPPPATFTDGFWARFALVAGVDLRSLPVSWLALDSRPPPPLPPGTRRVLGRPRVYKAHALILACDAEGVAERTLSKRRLPDAFRQLKKARFPALTAWTEDAGEITATSSPAEHAGSQ